MNEKENRWQQDGILKTSRVGWWIHAQKKHFHV